MPAASRASTSSGSGDVEAVRRPVQASQVLRRARSGGPPRARSVSNTPSPSWKPRSNDGQVRGVGGQHDRRRPRRGRRTLTRRPRSPPMAPSGPRALATVSSHSAAGSLPQVMPPPTWRVRRRPSATNVRMRMLVCIAPSGPIQPRAPVYGPRRTGSSPSSSSIARIFGRAGDRTARERGRQQVERVPAGGQPPGHRRDEVLDGGRPLESAQPRDADRCPARTRARGRCAGRRRSSRSRPGPWRSPAARRRARGPPPGRDRAAACP